MGQSVSEVHQDVAVQVERLRDQVDEPKNLQGGNFCNEMQSHRAFHRFGQTLELRHVF